MPANANIKAIITADDRASATLKNFGDQAGKTGKKIKKGFKVAAVAVAAAGAAAIAFGVSSVKSYQESENALAQLNAVLKSTKGVAGVTAKAATNLANSLQKVTKFSDEEVLSAENLLLTFTKIGKDIFPQATKTVLDMSTALGQDTKSSAIQLGKALQDPILGITALRRVGVNFNDAQKDVIKNLVETGRSAEAQRLILKELTLEFGGSAEAAGKTFSGRLAILKNQFDEVKESIGLAIVNGITPLMSKLAEFVASDKFQLWLTKLTTWLEVNLPIAINYVTTTLIPSLVNIFNTLWPVIQTVIGWMGNLIKFFGENEWAVYAFAAAIVAIKTALFLSGALKAFQTVMAGVRSSYMQTQILVSTPIVFTIAIAAALIALATLVAAARNAYDTIKQIMANADSRIATTRANLRDAIADNKANPTPANKKRQNKAYVQDYMAGRDTEGLRSPGQASGTDFFRGGATMVGERGPEMVSLPRGSKVHRADETRRMGGGGITVNLSVPMMVGSISERRRVARMLIKDIQDIASMNGKSASDMLNSNYGLVA